jgi:hypothetical protein
LKYYGDETGKSLIDTFKNEYLIYPKPYLITSLWDKDFLNTEKLKKHPSRGAYLRGCRCDECKAINTMMVKRYRASLKSLS